MVTPEDLAEFVKQLRGVDYKIGAQECITAQNLLASLAARGLLPDDKQSLRTFLAPIFCASPAEQDAFERHFNKWLGLKQSSRQTRYDTKELKTEREFVSQRRRLSRRLKLLAWGAAALLSVAGVIVAIRFFLPPDFPPPARVVFGQVVGESNDPLAEAGISLPDSEQPITSDEHGSFAFAYPSGNPQFKIDVTHPGFDGISLDVDSSREGFLYIRLHPAPEQELPPAESVYIPPAQVAVSPLIPPRYFILVLTAVGLLPLLAFGLWLFYRLYRRHAQLRKWRTRHKPEMEQIAVAGAAEQLYQGSNFRRTIQELRRHRPVALQELDVRRTVEATVNNGLWFSPVFDSRKVTPEYLALVDRAGFRDAQARLSDELIAYLQKDGVFINRYNFDTDPRFCREDDPTVPHVPIQVLAGRFPDHHLLIFSDGAGLFNPISGRAQRWLELLLAWPNRTILTPVPRDNWAYREWLLANLDFLVVQTGKPGLDQLAESLSSGTPAKIQAGGRRYSYPELLRERPQRWLEGSRPEVKELNKLCFQLRMYLGGDGYYLLCACAVYPALSWDLTVYLGYRLIEAERLEERLLALLRLPWFRFEVMPDWLRSRLISDLRVQQEQGVRHALEDLLISYLEHPRRGFRLEVAPRPKEARVPWWKAALRYVRRTARRRKTRRLLRDFIKYDLETPLHDFVFLEFISGARPQKLAVRLPKIVVERLRHSLRHLLYPKGQRVFGLRPANALVTAAVFCLFGSAFVASNQAVDLDIGRFIYTLSPIPLRVPEPAVGFTISPNVGKRGQTVPLVISVNDCQKSSLRGSTLEAPSGSLSFKNVIATDCQLKADLVIDQQAKLGENSIAVRQSDNATASLPFTVTDASCPTVSIGGPGVVSGQAPLVYNATISGAPGGQSFTYEWSVSAGTIENGQGTPSITVTPPAQPPRMLVATVNVNGLNATCAHTASMNTIFLVEPPPSCAPPFNAIAVRHPIDEQCPAEGSAQSPAQKLQNRMKNNFCASGASVPVDFSVFDDLQRAVEDAGVPFGRTNNLPSDRSVLVNLLNVGGRTLGEGSLVTLVGYVANAKHSDSAPLGFGGESVNCNNPALDWNDIHVDLVSSPDAGLCQSVTAEIIPHARPLAWDRFDVNPKIAPLVNGLPLKGARVRITGQLFFDASHTPCGGDTVSSRRRSVWEIHPVYAIDVFDTASDRWMSLEAWAQNK